MAYTPTTWVTGDTITAVKLNNMEQGIADAGIFFVETEWDDTKGGYEILTPLADIATATADGRTCKTTGDLYGYVITAESFPGGYIMIGVDDRLVIQYDATPPILIAYRCEWDSANSVLMEESSSYVLTPAT